MILHLVSKADWEATPAGESYRAPSLKSEGFIHCSPDAATVLKVGNVFYAREAGDFVLLYIDEALLKSELKWEAPAHPAGPVEAGGSTPDAPADAGLPAETYAEQSEPLDAAAAAASEAQDAPTTPAASEAVTAEVEFPHVYGPINREAIVAVRMMKRAEDGRFTGVGELLPMPVAASAPAQDTANPLKIKTPSQMADELLDATEGFSDALKRYKDKVESRMERLDDEIKKKLG